MLATMVKQWIPLHYGILKNDAANTLAKDRRRLPQTNNSIKYKKSFLN
jgi:hypothetical protein